MSRTYDHLIDTALELALTAHKGQKDKSGKVYVLHPIRLMFRFDDSEAQLAALLHDSVEDSALEFEDLRKAGIPEEVIQAVDALSRREDESYDDYLDRLEKNPLAVRVKLADLEDNLDLKRLNSIQEKDIERLKKYHRVRQRLLNKVR